MASLPPPLLLLLLLHLHLVILLPLHPSSGQEQPSSLTLSSADLSALLDIRTNLRDLPGSNFFSTWDFTSADPCTSFTGVLCEDDGGGSLRVSVLSLGTGLSGSPGLTGTLSPSIANLTALTELVIYPGRISGSIPANIGSGLRRLRFVSISSNLISGPIPASLAGLLDLHTLDLGHNQLQGPIPSSLITSLPSLKVLILASNGGLSGELPANISATQILHIDVRQNAFSGELPPLPTTLRYLSASSNSLSGCLSPALDHPPPDLAFLDLSMNAFNGQIPSALFLLPELSSILLQRNNLSGFLSVPPNIAAPPWAVVDLSHNMLTGGIPAELATAGSLYLNSNRLTGAVPAEYGRSVYGGTMSTFYAQHNFLTGFPVPPLPLPESVSLCLSYNCLVPPPESAAGCPANAGTQLPRPADQCPGATAGGDR